MLTLASNSYQSTAALLFISVLLVLNVIRYYLEVQDVHMKRNAALRALPLYLREEDPEFFKSWSAEEVDRPDITNTPVAIVSMVTEGTPSEFKKQLEQSFPCRIHGESIYTPVIGNRGTCQDSMWISSPITYSPTTSAAAQRSTRDTRRRPQSTDLGEQLISLLQEPPTAPHMPDSELEESYYFAFSLVPMLQRLDKDRKHQAK
ncbi:hypothetical protein KUCAC02_012196, partial [Chaenocephalus aceratus]